jgi:hypothetical protein
MNDQRTGVLDQWSLYCFVVSIVLKDFVAHAESHPEAPQNANEGCIRQAIGDALVWCRDFAKCDQMRCFFDRGEPFHGYLKHMLESKKAKADAALLNLIQHASESNAALLPALQMADMFAWVENNKSEPWNPTWKKTILGLPYRWQRIDKSNIHDVNHAHQITWNTWKIPKRAKTK